MTSKEAKYIGEKLWKELSRDGRKKKHETKAWVDFDIMLMKKHCPLCDFFDLNCAKCPMMDCSHPNSAFQLWAEAVHEEECDEAERQAMRIANAIIAWDGETDGVVRGSEASI
jgi:hypothetical protein